MQKKLQARQRLDDIEEEFLPENNAYVREMLEKEEQRKQKMKDFEERLIQKRKEIIMQTPLSQSSRTYRHPGQPRKRISRTVARAFHATRLQANQKRSRTRQPHIQPQQGSIKDLQIVPIGADAHEALAQLGAVPIDMFKSRF